MCVKIALTFQSKLLLLVFIKNIFIISNASQRSIYCKKRMCPCFISERVLLIKKVFRSNTSYHKWKERKKNYLQKLLQETSFFCFPSGVRYPHCSPTISEFVSDRTLFEVELPAKNFSILMLKLLQETWTKANLEFLFFFK